jgi:signal transduction histidine kinase
VAWEDRDSGPGIPDELRDQVFTPFFTTREKGTGLGLAFVRDIVRDHGAEIALDRGPEGGARFRFVTGAL